MGLCSYDLLLIHNSTYLPGYIYLFIIYARWMTSKYVIGCLLHANLWIPNISTRLKIIFWGVREIVRLYTYVPMIHFWHPIHPPSSLHMVNLWCRCMQISRHLYLIGTWLKIIFGGPWHVIVLMWLFFCKSWTKIHSIVFNNRGKGIYPLFSLVLHNIDYSWVVRKRNTKL